MSICHSFGITGDGDTPLCTGGVMIVGIAPGRDEVKTGKPFTGSSGKLLDATLEAVGWPRKRCYVTNVVCWRPTWPDGTDRDPTDLEIEACWNRLADEIKLVKPRLIVALGLTPARVLYPEHKATRGAVLWSDRFSCWILPVMHPAAILRFDPKDETNNRSVDFVRDMKKILYIMSWDKDYTGPHDHVCNIQTWECLQKTQHIRVVENAQEGRIALLTLDTTRSLVSIDFETDSQDEDEVDVGVNKILCVGISDGEFAWVFPAEIAKQIDWAAYENIKWLAHYGLFDAQVARQELNWKIQLTEDSLLQSCTIDERPGVHKAKVLTREYLGANIYPDTGTPNYEDALRPYLKNKKSSWANIPPPVLYRYNGRDCLYEHNLATQYFIPEQHSEAVRGYYENILIPALNAFVDIQFKGMYVNRYELRQLGLDWLPRLIAAEQELVDIAHTAGIEDINLESDAQLRRLLYDIFHLPVLAKTAKTNAAATDAKTLEQLKDLHPFVNKLLAYRKLNKMVNTYILGMEDDIKADSHVHAIPKLHGTNTGRLSYVKPPLQTMPDEPKMGSDFGRIRNIFTAESDDYVIISADYNRAELYVASAHSRDKVMYDDLTKGDIHKEMASLVYEKPTEFITSGERAVGKIVSFGTIYGFDEFGAAYRLSITREHAKELLKKIHNRYHDYFAWTEEQKLRIRNDGEVVSFFGRKRRFPLITDRKQLEKVYKQGINCVIQGDASDATLTSMIELKPLLEEFDSKILLLVHDSIIAQLNKKYLHITIPLMHSVMTKPRHPMLPSIPVEMKLGYSWGLAKQIDLAQYGVTI